MTASRAEPAAHTLVKSWVAELREARLSVGLSQHDVARAVGVQRETVVEWETYQRHPTLSNLLRLARELGWQFVVVDRQGEVCDMVVDVVAGESWVRREIRGIVSALRAARRAAGLSQAATAAAAGVTAWSLGHFERCQVNPRLVVLAAWVRAVGCSARWQRIV